MDTNAMRSSVLDLEGLTESQYLDVCHWAGWWPDPCPTGEHKHGCCSADDHDYPVACSCHDIPYDAELCDALNEAVWIPE